MFTEYSGFFSSIALQSLGVEEDDPDFQFLGSSSFVQTLRVKLRNEYYFLKFSEHLDSEVLQAEAKGLNLLKQRGHLHVPQVCGQGVIAGISYLLLEYIPVANPEKQFSLALAEGLALQHQVSNARYGLDHQNFIGNLPQRNTFTDAWTEFYISERLEVQLGLGLYNGSIDTATKHGFDKLYSKLPELLPVEAPALLHGDLWSGNVLMNHEHGPCLVDPSAYYGHREVELAYMRLFGGFDDDFFNRYNEVFPIAQGFEERVPIYQLYPLLVHHNLFGEPYLEAVKRTIRRYIG
jgi:protein-ribulosamine 3-kinase